MYGSPVVQWLGEKQKNAVGSLRNEEGTLTSDDAQMSESFKKYFASVQTREDMLNIPPGNDIFSRS